MYSQKFSRHRFALRLMPTCSLFSIVFSLTLFFSSTLIPSFAQTAKPVKKVALVDFEYIRAGYKTLRDTLEKQKAQWQLLREAMKKEKAIIDTQLDADGKLKAEFKDKYKKRFDAQRIGGEQHIKELQLNIEESVKAVASEGGYTEIQNCSDGPKTSANHITMLVINRLNN